MRTNATMCTVFEGVAVKDLGMKTEVYTRLWRDVFSFLFVMR
jgi:hypothetical protein